MSSLFFRFWGHVFSFQKIVLLATADNVVVRIIYKGDSLLMNECNMSRLNAWKYQVDFYTGLPNVFFLIQLWGCIPPCRGNEKTTISFYTSLLVFWVASSKKKYAFLYKIYRNISCKNVIKKRTPLQPNRCSRCVSVKLTPQVCNGPPASTKS